MSIVFLFSFTASFFLRPMSTFAHFITSLVIPYCVCYQCLTTGMCNPAHCPHTLCPTKCLVLAYSTIVTISIPDSDWFSGETPNCQPFTRGCDWGKLVPSSHKRGELKPCSCAQFAPGCKFEPNLHLECIFGHVNGVLRICTCTRVQICSCLRGGANLFAPGPGCKLCT